MSPLVDTWLSYWPSFIGFDEKLKEWKIDLFSLQLGYEEEARPRKNRMKWGHEGIPGEKSLCLLLCTFLQNSRKISFPEGWSVPFLDLTDVRKHLRAPLDVA